LLGEDLFTPTGGVIGDYSLLLEYLKKCRERGARLQHYTTLIEYTWRNSGYYRAPLYEVY
jgi:glycine/D-amino acid oxidase-like deaminating enzyme